MSRVLRPKSSHLHAVLGVAGLHILVLLLVRSGAFSVDRRSGEMPERYLLSFLLPERERPVVPQPPHEPVPHSLALPAPRLPESIALESEDSPEQPAPAIDWNAEIASVAESVVSEDQRRREHGTDFTPLPKQPEPLRLFADEEFGRDVPWSYRTRRIEHFPNGTFVVWLSERCFLIAGIFPMCKIGKLAETDSSELFLRLQRPQRLLPETVKLDTIVAVTRGRLAAIAKMLGQWRIEHGSYPARITELFGAFPASILDSTPVDPWGNALVFAQPSRRTGCEYDLYSLGKNGNDDHGEQDDIAARDHCAESGRESP